MSTKLYDEGEKGTASRDATTQVTIGIELAG